MARDYNRENILRLSGRYRTQAGLLLLDRASVKFDLADEIAIGSGIFRNARSECSRVPSNGWDFIGNKYFLLA